MPHQRIAVVGGVASGPAAAAEAKRVDPEADVVLFEQRPRISYGACEMPYYVAGWIEDAERLVQLTPQQFARTRGVAVYVYHRVEAIHPKRNRIVVRDLRGGEVSEERFDKIILATGARARMPGIDGQDAPNVFPVRRLEDAIDLRGFLEMHAVGHAVILGGGYVGVEMAEALRERGVRVSILEPRGTLLNRHVDAELCGLVHDAVTRHGVLVRKEAAVRIETDARGFATVVVTDRGERIGCQMVIVAMGITPNTELAQAAGIRVGASGALDVDDHMRTNLPNVWACGDVAEVRRVIDDAKIMLPLSTVAFGTSRVAARNAARRGRGGPERYPGVTVASAVKVFELEVASLGLRLQEAIEAGFDAAASSIQHWSRVSFYPGAKPLHVRYVVERRTGRLLGAELVGEEGAALRADVLVPLIRSGATVFDMGDLDLVYTPPFAPSHDPLLVAAYKARGVVSGWSPVEG